MGFGETGKQRAVRIPLDYYKRRNNLERGKLVAAAVVVVAAAAWWSGGYLAADRGRSRYTHGPLAEVHATWETQCTACHADFVPLRADAWAARSPDAARTSDAKCEACHRGPAHFPTQKAEKTPTCAGCHHDHSGRGAQIARVGDATCVGCHANLAAATHGAPRFKPPLADVTRFDVDHPQFRSIGSDPGRLKFSHWRHLLPGLTQGAADKTPPWTLAQIPAGQRERYRRPGQRDADALRLECGACHQLDSAGFNVGSIVGVPGAVLPARAHGARMLPITYENQCRACHPLPLAAGSAKANYEPDSPELLPHRLSPEQIRQALRRTYAGALVDRQAELLEKYVPPRPMPGKPWVPDGEAARKRIDEKVALAESYVRELCLKCHDAAAPGQTGLAPLAPTAVPAVWLPLARFDHAAHRGVDCRACHARAYADDAHASRKATDVMIPDRDVCLTCHAPQAHAGAEATGGARFDCAECHTYHAGDHPLQGRGSPLRDAATKSNVRRFLTGDVE